MFFICAAVSSGTTAGPSAKPPWSGIIPRPRLEKLESETAKLAEAGGVIWVSRVSGTPESATLTEGLGLLAARFKALGCFLRKSENDADRATVLFEKCTPEEMAATLSARGIKDVLDARRLAQAYHLTVAQKECRITIKASGNLGLYYGIVSLVQLVEPDSVGVLRVPVGEILDWPEIALRLAKTSGTENAPDLANRFAAWMPLYKMSQIGLQFHGKRSRELDENFVTNVKTICGWARRSGVCETVVYFCPFRRESNIGMYDFSRAGDRTAYAQLLQDFLDQGAQGVEVDYNDWPGNEDSPIENVINLACASVWEKDPDAYVYYCAPVSGTSSYRGPATPEMKRILSKTPARVWPLWTGPAVHVTIPLSGETVDAWTQAAGRRPILWLNSVGLGARGEFGRAIDGPSSAHVFQGERLPKALNRHFAGIHFNAGMGERSYNRLPKTFSPKALVYFATAADYIWNPHDWEAADSCRRATRFATVMAPLLEQGSSLMGARMVEPEN